ncbi:hypothetical protein like AT4G26980 [Hibiscus trionum]|uniref:RNI-like superfamily protein n=1 Tax=Hibiscus trionum TaxID=183268 RepID=A0A9W7JBY1_HIBTR|nr:hypothetical protein like AT4G26980 [Hibiscus trionum]
MTLSLIAEHLKENMDTLSKIVDCPPEIKIKFVAMSRRKQLLSDDFLISMANSSWSILDLPGSEVTDVGITKVAELCISLRALDMSRCKSITADGVSKLVQQCKALKIIRFGGCSLSEAWTH